MKAHNTLSLNSLVALLPQEWEEIGKHVGLSRREMDIVQGLCAGRSPIALADHLGISVNTINTHLGRMHRKLGVHNTVGLVARTFGTYVDLVRSEGPSSPTKYARVINVA